MNSPLYLGIKYAMGGLAGFLFALGIFNYAGLELNIAVVIGATMGSIMGIVPYTAYKAFAAGQKSVRETPEK